MRTVLTASALLGVILVGACRVPPATVSAAPGPVVDACCLPDAEEVTLEYLGVGGWLLRYGGDALLTAPFFSNPGLFEVGFTEIRTDTAVVDRDLPPVEDVSAILVGHGHYDHLMDVPYIARTKAPRATVYGSRTVVNTLLGDPGLTGARLVEVESRAGNVEEPGEWIDLPGGRIRFMALRSEHAPHYMGITLYSGEREEPMDALPERANGWLKGQTLAYLVDLLGPDGEVVYRIHYQDAAATPPAGFPPHLPDRRPVDLMIVCPPGAEEADGYPEVLVRRLAPTQVLLGHWEDFFRSRTEELRVSPGTDMDAFIRRLEGALGDGGEWLMPEPGTVVRIVSGR